MKREEKEEPSEKSRGMREREGGRR